MKVQINDYQESLQTKKAQINISHNTSYIMSKSSEIMPIEKYLDEQHSISLPVKANVNEISQMAFINMYLMLFNKSMHLIFFNSKHLMYIINCNHYMLINLMLISLSNYLIGQCHR